MERQVVLRGAPESIRTDNGGEFWKHGRTKSGVKLDLIRPGKPVENGCVESFNGGLRDECLNSEIFFDLADAREKLERWRRDYDESDLIARSMTEHRRSLPRQWGRGFSPSPTSIRQAHNPVKGSLPPAKNLPPLTGLRSRLPNLI